MACTRGGRELFSGLDIALGPGEAMLVTGRNGAGKSSLLRLIAGLLPYEVGQLSVAGHLSLANDQMALDANLPLAKALGFWAGIDGKGAGAVNTALDALAMNHLRDVPVRILSTGQRKRAVLARTVASGAEIWLLDEPSNGLDADSVNRLEALIATHREKGGIAVIASHLPIKLPGANRVRIGG